MQELLYAMERMADDKTLAHYHVPPVRGGGRYLLTAGLRPLLHLSRPYPSASFSTLPHPLPTRQTQQGCKVMLAIERAKLDSGLPDPDSAYWN